MKKRKVSQELRDAEVKALYRTCSRAWLAEMRAAFVLDQDAAATERTRDFCRGRIALIDAELQRREGQ